MDNNINILDSFDSNLVNSKYQGKLEIDINGKILYANRFFLKIFGYQYLEEIKGNYHSLFLDKKYAQSKEYKNLWLDIIQGKIQHGCFKRKHKQGRDIIIAAAYNVLYNAHGVPFKIVKYATKLENAELAYGEICSNKGSNTRSPRILIEC